MIDRLCTTVFHRNGTPLINNNNNNNNSNNNNSNEEERAASLLCNTFSKLEQHIQGQITYQQQQLRNNNATNSTTSDNDNTSGNNKIQTIYICLNPCNEAEMASQSDTVSIEITDSVDNYDDHKTTTVNSMHDTTATTTNNNNDAIHYIVFCRSSSSIIFGSSWSSSSSSWRDNGSGYGYDSSCRFRATFATDRKDSLFSFRRPRQLNQYHNDYQASSDFSSSLYSASSSTIVVSDNTDNRNRSKFVQSKTTTSKRSSSNIQDIHKHNNSRTMMITVHNIRFDGYNNIGSISSPAVVSSSSSSSSMGGLLFVEGFDTVLVDRCQFVKATPGVSYGSCLAIIDVGGFGDGDLDPGTQIQERAVEIRSSLFMDCGTDHATMMGGGVYISSTSTAPPVAVGTNNKNSNTNSQNTNDNIL